MLWNGVVVKSYQCLGRAQEANCPLPVVVQLINEV